MQIPDYSTILQFISENPWSSSFYAIGTYTLIALLHDIFQRRHAIKHNFPLVGRLRYLFETIGPELRQYWVANDKEEMPFSRAERSWVYATAKNKTTTSASEPLNFCTKPVIRLSNIARSRFPNPK